MSIIKDHRNIGGILLVAGTAIGAGMLALPLTTGIAGFFYAIPTMILIFVYMLCCLFLLLEANLYSTTPNANIISMAKQFLGPIWQAIAWMSFLLLLYSASAAYIDGGGSLISSYTQSTLHLSHNTGTILFALLFGAIGYFGIKYIDLLNRFLMFGLLASYLLLTITISPHVTLDHLSGGQPKYLWAAVPVLILSFTSHIILPSLRQYLGNDIANLKKVLIIGSLVPLLFYIVWEGLLVGILPQTGPSGLISVAQAVHPLSKLSTILQSKNIFAIVSSNAAFSFFAMVTSYLGVIISLGDFLADGLNISKSMTGRLILMTLSFLPPLVFALCFPSGFIAALSYGGVFIAILYGLIPAMIVWKARYHLHLPNPGYRFFFGKSGIALIGCAAITIICLQIAATQNLLPSITIHPHIGKHHVPTKHK